MKIKYINRPIDDIVALLEIIFIINKVIGMSAIGDIDLMFLILWIFYKLWFVTRDYGKE